MKRGLKNTWNKSASTGVLKKDFTISFFFLIIFFLSLPCNTSAQEVYRHVSDKDIYDFLDELANAHVISINSAVKPYSRMLIAEKLYEAHLKKELLNNRERKELDFYLEDYNKELNSDRPAKSDNKRPDFLYYKDSLFTFSLNPVLGFSFYANDTVNMYQHRLGGEAFAYVGKKFGFYASFNDNRENKRLADPSYLNQFPGAVYRPDGTGQGGEYSEMRGGMTFTWDWGSIGLIKDNFVWGDNYNGSNIFSGRAPSFAQLRLHLNPFRWLDFNYVHGWLVSEVIDSAGSYFSYPDYHVVFHPKYLAANMLTVTPWKNFNLSVGNSVIYSDRNVRPACLIPFFFYTSTGHAENVSAGSWVGENSQVFFNISSRQLKNVHLYTSFFVDEFSFGNVFNEKTQSNFVSGKAGAHLGNFPLRNLFLTAEYTRTNPFVYRHSVNTITFASNSYNLGHYLGDNAQEIFFCAGYRPVAKLSAEISYTIAQKGAGYPYPAQTGGVSGNGSQFIRDVYWQATEFEVKAHYQVIHDCNVFAGILLSDHQGVDVDIYTQPYFREKRTTINIGATIGF